MITDPSGTSATTMPATTPPQSKHLVRLMERLRERGSLDVYDAGFTEVYLAVPWSRVRHFPLVARSADALPFGLPCDAASAERVRRSFGTCLVLCPDDGACGGGSCARGADCPMVHADVSGLASRGVHVHASWPSLGAVPYRRVTESVAGAFGGGRDGAMVEVLQPNERQPAELVRADRLLLTAGALAAAELHVAADGAPRAAASRCAHFHFNWMCNRGESCRFVHVVHIDEEVVLRRGCESNDVRAPAVCLRWTLAPSTTIVRSDTKTSSHRDVQRSPSSVQGNSSWSCDGGSGRRSPTAISESEGFVSQGEVRYRHNPYGARVLFLRRRADKEAKTSSHLDDQRSPSSAQGNSSSSSVSGSGRRSPTAISEADGFVSQTESRYRHNPYSARVLLVRCSAAPSAVTTMGAEK